MITLALTLAWTLYLLTHLVGFLTTSPLLFHLGLVIAVCAVIAALVESHVPKHEPEFAASPPPSDGNATCIAWRERVHREAAHILMPR